MSEESTVCICPCDRCRAFIHDRRDCFHVMQSASQFSLGMIKMAADTAKTALEVNLPDPWLKRYAIDVPACIEEINRLRSALHDSEMILRREITRLRAALEAIATDDVAERQRNIATGALRKHD